MHRLFNIFALFVLFSTFSVFLLFFVLYIKDINIKFDIIILFADDTNVFMSRKDLNYFRYVKLGDGQTVNLVLKFKS